ncbi:HAD domain-containing protein [Rapidithrix thailandica]|uniref:HAD domain-containing protein n=1 Tax=Rapidithrix thailandica TaxID=413964 RepID=A0AAW9S881_9BACT
MKNVIILDLDGVLITTPSWKPDEIHIDGYSEFNRNAVRNLNKLLEEVDAELWLSSTKRMNQSLEKFKEIFASRNINKELNEARKRFWMRTDPMIGFNSEKLIENKKKIKTWDNKTNKQ